MAMMEEALKIRCNKVLELIRNLLKNPDYKEFREELQRREKDINSKYNEADTKGDLDDCLTRASSWIDNEILKNQLVFVNRTDQIDSLISLIKDISDEAQWPKRFPLISAPSQYGVTWLLKEVKDRLLEKEKEITCLFIDFKEKGLEAKDIIKIMLNELGYDDDDFDESYAGKIADKSKKFLFLF